MKRGDSVTTMALLTPDVMVLEAGGIEDRAAYRSGHLAADIRHAMSVRSERDLVRARVSGGMAWVVFKVTTTGESDNQPGSAGAELAVLTRTPTGWRIQAIHWSSRRRAQ